MYIQLILGEKCNINCSYCHLGYKNPKTSLNKEIIYLLVEKIKRTLLNQGKDYNKEQLLIEFQGGEPLIYLDIIKETILLFKQNFQKVQFILTTNGTLIDNNFIKFLKRNKQSISLNVSFDGNNIITTINRTQNERMTENIIKNIQDIIKNNINITIIGTINKIWLENSTPEEIKEFLEQRIAYLSEKNNQISYFFRPEILLDSKESYGIELNKIIDYHQSLSKIITNQYYKIKYQLIEFNPQLAKNTLCIDYNGTIYPNDYVKSYIKRFNTEILKDYEYIFNIYNIDTLDKYQKILDNFSYVNGKNENNQLLTGISENLLLSPESLNNILLNKNKYKKISNILLDINNTKEGYFVFRINKETNYLYSNI